MGKPTKALTGFDIFAMINELKNKLVGLRIKKIYQIGDTFYFIFAKDTDNILIIGPNRIHLSNYKQKFPLEPWNFCMLLRKSLEGARLESIEQHGFDRIIELKFTRPKNDETRYVIAELFADGNLILLNEKLGIIAPLKRQEWKARIIREKLPYVYPPETKDLRKLSLEDFSKVFIERKSDVVRTLASIFGMGSLYAEEICARTNIEKEKKGTLLSSAELEKIYSHTKNLFDEVIRTPTPVQVIENDIPREVSPIKLVQFPSSELKTFNSFSEACDEFFIAETVEKISEKEEKFRERFERMLESQRENLEKIEYHLKEWKEEADKLSAELDFKSAAELYEKIKKARRKLPGVQEAIKKTEQKISTIKVEERLASKKEIKQKQWFEKFRAFTTSDGFLVVCGKDATTNEILIKKYTTPNDIAFHADIAGASFCVIKTDNKPVPGSTLEEVAEIAASYSKAWQRGLGTIDVYWVKPEQLSKKAPSGEYVSHGAFVVSGKKNYFYKTVLGLAIGIDKEFKVIAGAISSVKKRAIAFSVITPGDEKSKELAEKIKIRWLKKSSKENSVSIKGIPLEHIQKFVPAGKGRMKE